MKKELVKLSVNRKLIKDKIYENGHTIKSLAEEVGISTNNLSAMLNRNGTKNNISSFYYMFLELGLEIDDIIHFVDENDNKITIKEAKEIISKGAESEEKVFKNSEEG